MRWRSISLRRLEALSVVFVMFAVPLTVMACVDSCAETQCPCCAAMSHAKGMNCRSDMSGKCAMSGRGETQQLPDFFLSAHQARNMPVAFAAISIPFSHRIELTRMSSHTLSGFGPVPFEPPRS